MSSKFCPTCVSSRRKRRSKSQESIDDGGFYQPSVPRTRKISSDDDDTNDDFQQPFEVPQLFRPIRVDSPALDSVRPRPKPNIKTKLDNEGRVKTLSTLQSHQADSIPLSPVAGNERKGEETQQEENYQGKIIQLKETLPAKGFIIEDKGEQKVLSILTKDKENQVEEGEVEECASSISSRSLSSLLNQFPDSEARQPLLLNVSQLDLEDDEEDVDINVQSTKNLLDKDQVDNECGGIMDLTPRASPIPKIKYSSTPSPELPPLPKYPPPGSSESEFSCSRRSSSHSVSCGRELVNHPSFERRMNSEGPGFSLSLVDMSAIRYADSASSCCSDNEYYSRESSRSRSRDPNYFQSEFTNLSSCSRPRNNHVDASTNTTALDGNILEYTVAGGGDNDQLYDEDDEYHSRSTTPTPPRTTKSSSIRITLKKPCLSASADVICSKKPMQENTKVSSESYPILTTPGRNSYCNYNDSYLVSLVSSSRSIANPTSPHLLQSIPEMSSLNPTNGLRGRTQSEGVYVSPPAAPDFDSDLDLAQNRNIHSQNSTKWMYQNRQPYYYHPYNSTGHPGLLLEDIDSEALKPLMPHADAASSSCFSLSLSSVGDDNNDQKDSIDREKYSPESTPSPNLSQISYECLVKPLLQQEQHPENQALDLASQSNVQDAFVIAVEQQARERLEKLSALKRIKPVDMTKLSHQLSEVPSGTGDTSELNGLIEEATGSPIYVTSASELSSSQSALHRTAGTIGGGGGELQDSDPLQDQVTTSTSTTAVDRSPLRTVGGNVTVVGINTSTISNNTHQLPSSSSVISVGDDNEENEVLSRSGQQVKRALPNGQYPDSAKKSSSRESINSAKKSSSRENLGDSRESVEVEGAKSISSRGRGSKLQSADSSRESIADPPQYANMINMVEWDNGPHREMAVDVPESFVPRNKTPPRYPPNRNSTLNSNNNNKTTLGKTLSGGGVVVSDGVRGNGTLPGQNGAAGKPVPPPRIGDKETSLSVNNNNTQVPHVPPRTVVSPTKTSATPSRDEAERIRKYQEELKKRREQEEKHAKEEEFLRTSLRGSKKLQALENRREESPSLLVAGFVNDAYDVDEDRIPHSYVFDTTLQKPVGLSDLVSSLQRVQQTLKKNGLHLDETVTAVGSLMQTPEFQQILAVHNKVQDVWCYNAPPTPFSAHTQQLVQECLGCLYNCSLPESAELGEILSRVDLEGVLYAHDKIAERERLLMTNESPLTAGESVDADPVSIVPILIPSSQPPVSPPKPSVRPAFVPEPQPDDRIKVVRIEKTQDPLGATVRNEADAVVIGRIVKGGAAERSGLLHEGDEILEVNGIEMRGKSVNEVCDILSRLTGTLTFLIVPTQSPPTIQQRRDVLIHVRAHFDYDPEDDIYLPCRELGIAFSKGDVLHVINQDDCNWWQAHREGEEDQALAGLIPSKSFQEQREAVKQQLLGETETREKSKKGTLLCAKSHKKKKKKIPYSSAFNDDFDAEEIPTYEEVSLYYPRTSFKRPVVLIGPPNIGRHELRQRLMQESERFAAAVPHTSRTKKDGEIDGQDYHFISRSQFESDILSRKFVEHGEFEKAYYGTSLDAIRSVVNLGKICVLNLHPQSLKMLRSSDLKPYIVFVAPPPLERLKQMRISRGEAYKEEELIDIIEKAREMEEKYGHYFDLVIINNDIERTYHELLQRINYTEREPQWVPAFWLKQ